MVNVVLFFLFFYFYSLSFWFLLCPTLYYFFSWIALFPFFLSIVIFTFLLVSSLLFSPSPPPLCVPPFHFMMGPSAGVAAVPPQYVQHAVPARGPTRLWDPPHIPSTFTFSFGLPGGKPKGIFPLHHSPVPVKGYTKTSGNSLPLLGGRTEELCWVGLLKSSGRSVEKLLCI